MGNIGKRFARFNAGDGKFAWMILRSESYDSELRLEGSVLVHKDLTGTPADYDGLAYRLDGAKAEGDVTITLENVLPPTAELVWAVGLNSPRHKKACGFGDTKPPFPTLFPKTCRLTTYGDPVYMVFPDEHTPNPNRLDPEVEMAVIMGKDAVNVPASDAMKYVAGIGVIVDWADRGVQGVDVNQGEMGLKRFLTLCQWSLGKSGRGYSPMAPTFAFVENPYDLDLHLDVNGKPQQRLDRIGDDIFFGIDEIIEFLSHRSGLYRGQVIAMGSTNGVEVEKVLSTPGGVADYMKRRDVVEGRIPGVGRVRNIVVPRDYQKAP